MPWGCHDKEEEIIVETTEWIWLPGIEKEFIFKNKFTTAALNFRSTPVCDVTGHLFTSATPKTL